MRIILCLMFIVLFSCHNAKTDQIQKGLIEKVQLEVDTKSPQDTCENIKQIIRIINKTLITNKIDFIDTTQFINLFRTNDNYKEGCYFPENDSEFNLLYQFSYSLVKMSSDNEFAIYLLMILRAYNRTNAEYSEYFMDLIPQIALDNLFLFVKALNILSDKNRMNTIGELGNISDKESITKLKTMLEEIKDPNLQVTIDEVRKFLFDESNFDL